MKYYNTNGEEFTDKGSVPPIGEITQEMFEVTKESERLAVGFYYQDEYDESNGPYKNIDEAIQAQNDHCRDQLGEKRVKVKKVLDKLDAIDERIKKRKVAKIIDIENPTDDDILIGQEVECRVSNFKGIISVKVENIYRVPQYNVQAKDKGAFGGIEKSYLFDGVQLRIINKIPIVEVKYPEPKIKLGQKAKDTVTNFTGVVVAREIHMNGCVRLKLKSEYKPGDETSMQTFSFDEGSLVVIPETVAPSKKVKPNKASPKTGCARELFNPQFD